MMPFVLGGPPRAMAPRQRTIAATGAARRVAGIGYRFFVELAVAPRLLVSWTLERGTGSKVTEKIDLDNNCQTVTLPRRSDSNITNKGGQTHGAEVVWII